MPVITIARLFGAGGDTVGQMVAQRLQADFLGPELIDQVARQLELPKEEVEAADEQPGSFLQRLLVALAAASPEHAVTSESPTWAPPYTDPQSDPRRAVLEHTQRVIREAARSGNVVIVGRGGAYVLHDLPGVLHVFLRADEATRVKAVMARERITEEEARRRTKHTDENRRAYIRQVYGHTWDLPGHYDIVLDTGRLGYDASVEAILAALHGRTR
ncbi:MAG TPA: cytidylate kinase-like family protein [Candidatus Dormibacteraeota bacterium]|nr:cytidylate kinase-like family protein [Candidatus Dormibacteraeota bacterium]